MEQASLLQPEQIALTVAQYIELINSTLATIASQEIVIIGEIVEYRVSQGKWINFELKDEEEEAKISCFTTIYKQRAPLEAGMKVQVTGYPKVYERFGKLSLNVETVELVGEGALARAYALLKQKLQEEGLFDVARKRVLPRFPERVGLITSREAAAYGDFMRILNNRWSGVEVVHRHVHVQGQHAVNDILEAFEAFNQLPEAERPEVIVLTRGGGSLEDLHAFNDEQVARAVFQSAVPVVVGVGHERDESLADFVADVRASTPSNAAERIVPDREDLAREMEMMLRRQEDLIQLTLDRRRRSIDHAVSVLDHFLARKVQDLQLTVDRFGHAMDRFRLQLVATRQYIERNEHIVRNRFETTLLRVQDGLRQLVRVFENFDVQKTLARGFAIIRQEGKILKTADKLDKNAPLHVQLAKDEIIWPPKKT
jgi:exodeoxyribonuclease VII large subunit